MNPSPLPHSKTRQQEHQNKAHIDFGTLVAAAHILCHYAVTVLKEHFVRESQDWVVIRFHTHISV